MGDILSSVPIIRYISNIYGYKVQVFTYMPDVFKNYPYIIPYYIDEYHKFENDFKIVSTFDIERSIHTKTDIRQIHAMSLGIQLLPDDLHVDFYPDDYIHIEELPDNYVVFHTSKTWPSRTWNNSLWQELCDRLISVGIKVVTIGKDTGKEVGTYKTEKSTIKIDSAVDLTNILSISQVWHVINKSNILVTMDSGILHLGGTTDTHIVQLGSSINPKYRTPYRQGSQSYKISYMIGKCALFCASDLGYAIKFNGDHRKIPPVPFCLKKPDTIGNMDDTSNNTYECHPSVDSVYNEIIRLYKYYNFKM